METLSLFPVSHQKIHDTQNNSAGSFLQGKFSGLARQNQTSPDVSCDEDDDENDVDFLIDDVDQFLSEIVNQRWSVNQVANFKPVQMKQTMFTGSLVQPLSLPELDRWAIKLRAKVRKFVKNKAMRQNEYKDKDQLEVNSDSSDE